MTDIQYDLQYITTDVTSVKFIGKWIIAGIGGCIHIYETNSKKLVARRKIFEKQRVHNILYKQDKYLGIIGGKVVHIFNFFKSDDFSYSALMYGDLWSNLIAFSGTVFKQILIWAPANIEDDSKDSPVLHTLKGHNGVIHSVSYDPPSQIICSTSDDRSVRIWGVDIQTSGNSDHVAQWRDANITLLHSVYGHTARVWKNVIANNCVVSAGEDSRLCFWNFDGILLKSWKTHQNGSVWSLDFNREENVIVTGGSDGGICLWPLHKDQLLSFPLHYEETLFERSMKNTRRGNFPKRIGMTKKGNIVAVTDSGYLLYCKVTNDMQGEWDIVYEEEKLTNYCLMEISPCRQYIATANINGYILIFTEFDSSEEDKLILQLEKKVVEGRIFSLHWLSSERLAICGPDGVIEVWELSEYIINLMTDCLILLSFCFIQGPVQSFYKIHGHLGVCCLGWYGNRLYSTGRDGTLRSFLLLEAECRLKPLNADRLCIEWPAALCQSDYGLLVLGFKSVNLLIWSHTERRILLRMPCGGGHRSWDWILIGKVFTFIYVKDKMIHMFVLKLDNIVQPIIKLGFHTTEIMCMKQLRLIEGDNDCHVFLSASEDTTVRLAVVDDSSVLKPLAVLQSHISSVRALATCLLKDGVLVFSGGGRAQLKVWKFVVVSVEENVPEITCEELFSHMLIDPNKRNKKPWLSTEHNSDPETRYMDLSALMIKSENIGEDALVFLAAACSDGFLRFVLLLIAYNSLY
ncbi:hypothetical protein C0J52_04509 [Blattella germanica]|nr:hypothetical protein C0J52_04509 [Blattella germanica]